MDYMAKNIDDRLDPQRRFGWLKSVICVALAYWSDAEGNGPVKDADGASGESDTSKEQTGKIARYAWGRDYHKVVTKRLETLEKKLRQAVATPFDARIYVDTGPLLEREFALRAGLGWIGKNTLIIHPRHGSYFVLGEMLTSLEFPYDAPMTDHCGTCTRCIAACPTDAITPYSVDATKCISYQTLENRGDIPAVMHEPMVAANYLIGCDICQEVCPFNRAPLPTREPDFAAQDPAPAAPLREVHSMDEPAWDKLTRGKAHRRAKLPMWQRNATLLVKGGPPGV
jgi:epoxyqueuosine reductase